MAEISRNFMDLIKIIFKNGPVLRGHCLRVTETEIRDYGISHETQDDPNQ
jgi:hypothetical protein